MEYTKICINKPCMYVVYIFNACSTVTRWLVLCRGTGSHSTRPASNDVARTRNDFDLAPLCRAFRIFAPGDMDTHGTPGAEDRRKVPCLTCKAHEPLFFDLSHSESRIYSRPNDKPQQTSSKWRLDPGVY